MNYAQIRNLDIANGDGIRVSLFVSGCEFNCKGCFNSEYQDFNYGNKWTDDDIEYLKTLLDNPNINGLSILGGEPFNFPNTLSDIIDNLDIGKSIWLWSGFVYEDLIKCNESKKLLERIDILVDGLFIKDLKNIKLKWRGSSNQRIIDVQESLIQDKTIIRRD